jgi:hypothetical protein
MQDKHDLPDPYLELEQIHDGVMAVAAELMAHHTVGDSNEAMSRRVGLLHAIQGLSKLAAVRLEALERADQTACEALTAAR